MFEHQHAISPIRGQHKPEMDYALCFPLSGDEPEIPYVLGNNRPLLLLCGKEDIEIRKTTQIVALGDCDNVDPTPVTKAHCDARSS